MELSRKCSQIAPSITLEIDAKAKSMKASGIDVVGFGAGEPDFDTPQFIKDAAKKALDLGKTKYTPASGTLEFKQAICNKLLVDNNLEYKPNQIVISNGAKHSLFNAFAAILNDGDEVIILSPYWVTYPELVSFCGGVPVYVNSTEEDGFVPKMADIKAAVTSKTKAIVINSPSNPCGAVMDRQTLCQIAEIAKQGDFFIISDEIYEKLIYGDTKHESIATVSEDAYNRTIVVNGLSKAFAMTGWRLGYTAANAQVTKLMSNLQSQATSNPNSIAQYAGTVALSECQDEVAKMVAEFAVRRERMCFDINATAGISCIVPSGAFYVMMNIEKLIGKSYNGQVIDGSMAFCNILLEAQNVAVVPGIAFGADNYCRLSYATGIENIDRGIARIKAFVLQLD